MLFFCSFKDSQRVRVAVRLRPRNTDEILSDADFADYIELQPELKRLKLRKNNWSFESYRFDEVFTETASQKRVYEVVAKPVVESVLSGYNGTIMVYGQTGTGKTYTVGTLGKDDASERGIMVRTVEDIIGNTSASDSVEVSYLQLYMESIYDLLAPEKSSISIHEDPKSGEVSLPGAEVVKVQDLDSFVELLELGEANRHVANTKLNTESSRSHAILMVQIRRSFQGKKVEDATCQDKNIRNELYIDSDKPMIQKSKLLIVDLAGSERIDKSGSEGHLLEEAKFINLSLTSLGKCINALAEKSPHIPTRESKLTRLLRDSFGGSSRTSLIITIGPSAKYHAETSSTVMFGQRAMKIVNKVKLREEVDYEALCRKLENQVDLLTAEVERQQKLRDNEKYQLENQLKECQDALIEMKRSIVTRSEFLEKENTHLKEELKDILNELKIQKDQNDSMHEMAAFLENNNEQQLLETSAIQKVLAETTQMYERKIAELIKQIEDKHSCAENAAEELNMMQKLLSDHQKLIKQQEVENSAYQKALAHTTEMYERKVMELVKQVEDEHRQFECAQEQLDLAKRLLNDQQNPVQGQEEMDELRVRLQAMSHLHETTANELHLLKLKYQELLEKEVTLKEELNDIRQRLMMEEKQRKNLENELIILKKNVPETENEIKENTFKAHLEYGSPMMSHKSKPAKETICSQKAAIAKICKEGKNFGIHIIAFMLRWVVNLKIVIIKIYIHRMFPFSDINQEKIVEEGGLDALLTLLQSSQNSTILRVVSGAIANLAMNEINQGLIVSKGGARLLAQTASKVVDSQTLRMTAGALANLCGNERLHMLLKEDGGIKALLEMVRSGNTDVIAQVARGLANFAKCEFRGIVQGQTKGCSLLMEHGALPWLIANTNTSSASTRRHIELALCHLAQNDDNAMEFISNGGVKELVRISIQSTREDIRNLAQRILSSNSIPPSHLPE
ncbi:kinesin-like protein KIN-UC isoform X2 [Senna tora]|uniref:Kinesin-like protein n=1 Tax=Senna tora TaxID=362788 RepID=A0A834WW97_9FABA|nr:kinesin-like protein KIN-UC isoform X2 [Senna tora]